MSIYHASSNAWPRGAPVILDGAQSYPLPKVVFYFSEPISCLPLVQAKATSGTKIQDNVRVYTMVTTFDMDYNQLGKFMIIL